MKATIFPLTLMLLSSACNANKDESTSDATTDATTTTGASTGGAMSGAGTHETTGSQTTTVGDGTSEASCAAMCERSTECMVDPEPDMCLPSCIQDLSAAQAECLAMFEAFVACFVGMTCDEIGNLFDNGEPGPCLEQYFGMLACAGEVGCGVGTVTDGQSECSTTIECAGEPAREMQCGEQECVCLIDGAPNGDSCQAEMICQQDSEALTQKAAECCGFESDE